MSTDIRCACNPEILHSRSVLRGLATRESMQGTKATPSQNPTSFFLRSQNVMKKGLTLTIVIGLALFSAGCDSGKVPASLRGYNHMSELYIRDFTVNGAMGSNISPKAGGGETCCVIIPRRWRPGLKAKVSWGYDKLDKDPWILPADQTAEVDIPKYNKPGSVQVHFYDGHRIKIVVSPCSPEHPFYPMSHADLAPWVAFSSREEMIEAAKRGGGAVDC